MYSQMVELLHLMDGYRGGRGGSNHYLISVANQVGGGGGAVLGSCMGGGGIDKCGINAGVIG